MDPESISSITAIANTVLLILIFFYHQNKNKVLNEQLDHQQKNIDRMSELVNLQSNVVNSTMEYAGKFNLKEVESLITRELNLQFDKEIQALKKQADEIPPKLLDTIVERLFDDLLSPYLKSIAALLSLQSPEDKEMFRNRFKETWHPLAFTLLTRTEVAFEEFKSEISQTRPEAGFKIPEPK